MNPAQPITIEEELTILLAEAERLQAALDTTCHRIADLTRLSTLRRHAVQNEEHAASSSQAVNQAAA